MKARFALLIGFIIVVIAYIAALAANNMALFNRICEWAFFVSLILATVLYASAGNKRKATNLRNLGGTLRLNDQDLVRAQMALDAQDPEIRKQNSKEDMKLALFVFLIGLPSLIAVLAEYFF